MLHQELAGGGLVAELGPVLSSGEGAHPPRVFTTGRRHFRAVDFTCMLTFTFVSVLKEEW